MNIRKAIDLIQSIQKEELFEGRHDDLFSQAMNSLKIQLPEEKYTFIEESEKVFSYARSKFKNFKNNSWKVFVVDAIITKTIANIIESGIEDQRVKSKLHNKLKKQKQKDDYFSYLSDSSDNISRAIKNLMDELLHFAALDYDPITNLNPEKKEKTSFIDSLKKYEMDYKNLSSELVEITGEEQLILDLGKYKWFNLGVGYCRNEGAAMRHCGNANASESDTILSLRQVVKIGDTEYHRPSLTFILDSNGLLGEMKGRGNNKPTEKYHPYIIELLKLDMIKGIKGGGYLPENNFDFDDLTDEQREEIAKIKGEDFLEIKSPIISISEKYEETGIFTYEMLEELENSFHEHITYTPNYKVSRDNKLTIDLSDYIQESPYYAYVTGDDIIDVEPISIDDYKEMLDFLDKEDFDHVIRYVMGYEDDIITAFDLEEDDFDESFVRDKLDKIIRKINFIEIKDSVKDSARQATESGTLNEIITAFFNAIREFEQKYFITLPENIYSLIDEDDLHAVISAGDLPSHFDSIISVGGDIEFKMKVPYYGFHDFDENDFKEILKENLIENDVIIYD